MLCATKTSCFAEFFVRTKILILILIIFCSSSHVFVSSFQEMMEKEFQMSMMGELTFFLDIQVKQTKQGTIVHQAKYTKDLMKKFNMPEL
jgi:hypothetical protein